MKRLIISACLLTLGGPAFATSFNITGLTTTKQTLAANETGAVASTGTLSVTGNNVAITVTGNATITNNGLIQQTTVNSGGNAGNGRAIRDNTGGLSLTVNNGSATNSAAVIQTVDGDIIQMKVAGSTITFNNYGTLNSLNTAAGGNQAIDWAGLTSGSNTLNNFSTGLILASEADAVRPGVNGVITNSGTIKSTTSVGNGSDGIDAQTNSGIVVTNSGLIEGGRHAITGGTSAGAYFYSVTNQTGGTIQGDNGSGINIDGADGSEVATIVNHGIITGNGHDIADGLGHDGDGVDVDGLVHLTNTGLIRSVNAYSPVASGLAYSEGITVGGGTITNSGTIEGLVSAGNTNAVGRGISLLGNDSLTIPGTREPIYGDATVTNQAGGLIRGQSDSAIVVDGTASGHTVSIENQAGGTIQGGGATAAAIQTRDDNDTITNAGTIDGSSSGKAIDMGAGNNTLNINGGSASILGDVSGGIGGTNRLVIAPGSGNTFSYAGHISNFSTVQLTGGTFNLSGALTAGTTSITGGTLAGSGTVGGLLKITSGGTIAPGNSPGKLTLQTGLDLSGGGEYLWQLGSLKDSVTGIAGTDFDQIALLGGNLALGGSSVLTLDFSLLGSAGPNSTDSFWHFSHDWTIIAADGVSNIGSTDFATINNATYADGTFSTTADSNGNIAVHYAAVPEPSTGLLVAGPLLLMAARQMRPGKRAISASK